MSQFEFIAPCHFGLEAVLKKEILRLGYDIKSRGRQDYLYRRQ